MKLLQHQVEDANNMACGDLPNLSEAGTGKTLSTLEAIRLAGVQAGLIIAPPIALPMWKVEIERHLGATAKILRTGRSTLTGATDFFVTSYSIAANAGMKGQITEVLGSRVVGNCLILDESHYIKNLDSKRTQAIMGRSGDGAGGLFEAFDNYWPLTGTPIMRYADDVWAQIRAAFPLALSQDGTLSHDDFVKKYCFVTRKQFHPRMAPQWVVGGNKNEEALNHLLYDTIGAVRRTMDEVKVYMPDLTYRQVTIALKDNTLLKQLMSEVEGPLDEDITSMAEMLHLLGMCKVDSAVGYLKELNKQVLVGYWHDDVGDALAAQLSLDGATARVKGGMTMEAKEAVRVRFNNGEIKYLVGQLSAMNVSWNLQESGNHVAIVEDNFSPGFIEQFVKRVWRIGQSNHVQVDMLKAEHKLDEAVTTVRERKENSNRRIL